MNVQGMVKRENLRDILRLERQLIAFLGYFPTADIFPLGKRPSKNFFTFLAKQRKINSTWEEKKAPDWNYDYDVNNDNQAAKRKGDEVPLEDLLVVLDVFDDKRADLPLGAFRGESAPEKYREFKGGCPMDTVHVEILGLVF